MQEPTRHAICGREGQLLNRLPRPLLASALMVLALAGCATSETSASQSGVAAGENGACIEVLRVVEGAETLTKSDVESWTNTGMELASVAAEIKDPVLATKLYEAATILEKQYGLMKVAEIKGDPIPDPDTRELSRLLAEMYDACQPE